MFPGDLVGPYVSQFLLLDVPYGATPFAQRLRTVVPDLDYLTNYDDWLAVQNGAAFGANLFDATRRHIRNARDLGEYVHRDFPQQSWVNAALILLNLGTPNSPQVFDSGIPDTATPFDAGNPYTQSFNQKGFAQFGAPDAIDLAADVPNSALRAAWYQKWSVHRRLRPEEFGGHIHNLKNGRAYPGVPIFASVLNSEALERTYQRWNSYLLPQAFPEGCPTHPAYPSGHAVYAGAAVTVLKAFFDENYPITNPVVSSASGTRLVPYQGPDRNQLTVGSELNKLASNIALGRNAAGVHWRTDAVNGILLGEQVGVRYLQDLVRTYNQGLGGDADFSGYTLTRFTGEPIRVLPNGTLGTP